MKTLLKIFLSMIFSLSYSTAFSQSSGSISGYIFSENDSLSIPGAYIIIETSQKKYWSTTDVDGFFKIKPIEPGSYSILVTYSGSDSMKINNIKVTSGLDTYLKKIYLTAKSLQLVEIPYKADLIDEDGRGIIKMDALMLESLPQKGDMIAVLKYITTDYFVSEQTNEVHFRGSRAGTSAYYIDGMRVEGMTLPGMGVGSMQIYAGGVPARFGDFTGGVVEVETKSYNDGLQEQVARSNYVKFTETPKIVTSPKPIKADPKEAEEAEPELDGE